jgi:outer membrane protein assembly factor BamA
LNKYSLYLHRQRTLVLSDLQGVSNANVMPTVRSEIVDVYFNVVEQKSNTLQLGLGYSNLDDNRFVFSNLNLLNILGGGETITLRFQLGLKKANGLETTAFTYRLRYSNMLIPEYKIVGALENYSETGPENLTLGGTVAASAVDIKRQATLAELTVPFSPRTKLITSIRFLDVLNNNPDAAALGVTVVGYKKNSLIGIFRYEDVKRDAYQNAFSGVLGVLRAEKSFGLAFGDGTLPFEKYDASSTFYAPLWSEQDVLMFNFAAGQVSFPSNQIVAEGELYKMGGPSTVRGYFSQSPFAIGSKKLQFNVEWRHIFNEVFSSLVFYDYGGAYDADLFTNLSTLLGSAFGYGFGAGLRANTPIGSMELTLAQNKVGQQLIHISLGATF